MGNSKKHILHTHPIYEKVIGLKPNKQIVDKVFSHLFSQYEIIENDQEHIIIDSDDLIIRELMQGQNDTNNYKKKSIW